MSSIRALLHLVRVFGRHGLITAKHDLFDLACKSLLMVGAGVSPDKALEHLERELVLGHSDLEP